MGSNNMRMATQVSGAPDKPFSWELGFTELVERILFHVEVF